MLHTISRKVAVAQIVLNKAVHLTLSSPFLLCQQYPPGYLAAMANKTKKEACARPGRGGRSKHYPGRGRPRRRKIKVKEENDEEDEEEEHLMASVDEEGPQSNGEQKTTRGSVGCFYRWSSKQVRQGVVRRRQVRTVSPVFFKIACKCLISTSVTFSLSMHCCHCLLLSKSSLLLFLFQSNVCVSTRVFTSGRASLQTGEDRGDLPAVRAAAAADPRGHSQQETLGWSHGKP